MPRVTKEDLRGNELVFYIQKIAEFFKKYWEKLKIILLVCGVAILFITLFILGNMRTNASATAELNSALAIYQNRQVPARERYTSARDMLKSLLGRSSHTNIKNEALFYLGSCHYFLGEYDEAMDAFTKCAPGLKKSSLGIYALQGIGKANEGKRNYSESLKFYQKALDEYPDHFIKANILLDIGRCYEKMGKVNEAVNSYQKILDFAPEGSWGREAKLRINILKG